MTQYEERYGYTRERTDEPVREYYDRPINPQRIRALRLKARRTQQELASAAEIGISTLSLIERDALPDDHRPRVATVNQLAEALGEASSGSVALSSRLRMCPNPGVTASLAAVPSAMPTSRSPIAVPRTTEPRATSPRRMLPLDVEVQIEQLAAP
jgi:transcriptional regulator with XRE-family HTH domain